MNELYLGIDTSNYTTSVSLLDENGIIANEKQLLNVKPGERGVRQSDAVFMHTCNLPVLMNRINDFVKNSKIAAIGVSSKPRNPRESYMPCFLAGVSAATSISCVSNIPLYQFSHQCGHIMAAVYSAGCFELLQKPFCAFHVSGGTTELVKVSYNGHGFDTEIVGGTLDLNAGQVIDRIGVRMGLQFPAGQALENLALSGTAYAPRHKVSAKGTFVNLSGLENLAIKLLNDSNSKELVASFVLNHIADAILHVCNAYAKDSDISDFLFAGGVMSNSIIKNKILKSNLASYFAEPVLSTDNAVGVAVLAMLSHLGK